jgi:hypothetical protein
MEPKITRGELEQQIIELARKYVETHTRKFEKRFTGWSASLMRSRRELICCFSTVPIVRASVFDPVPPRLTDSRLSDKKAIRLAERTALHDFTIASFSA